jgi:hypothetical protein
MSTVLNKAILGVGSAAGQRLADRGQIAALDSSTTALAVGAATVTADSYVVKNGDKILYTALTGAGNNQLYMVSGLGSISGAQFTPVLLGSQLNPSVGDVLSVKFGSSNGGLTFAWAAGMWSSISVAIGA